MVGTVSLYHIVIFISNHLGPKWAITNLALDIIIIRLSKPWRINVYNERIRITLINNQSIQSPCSKRWAEVRWPWPGPISSLMRPVWPLLQWRAGADHPCWARAAGPWPSLSLSISLSLLLLSLSLLSLLSLSSPGWVEVVWVAGVVPRPRPAHAGDGEGGAGGGGGVLHLYYIL